MSFGVGLRNLASRHWLLQSLSTLSAIAYYTARLHLACHFFHESRAFRLALQVDEVCQPCITAISANTVYDKLLNRKVNLSLQDSENLLIRHQ